MIIIATIMSIVAAIYVSRGKALIANIIWAVSNICFILHNVRIAEYEMLVLFASYEIIALYGIWNLWGRKYIWKKMVIRSD